MLCKFPYGLYPCACPPMVSGTLLNDMLCSATCATHCNVRLQRHSAKCKYLKCTDNHCLSTYIYPLMGTYAMYTFMCSTWVSHLGSPSKGHFAHVFRTCSAIYREYKLWYCNNSWRLYTAMPPAISASLSVNHEREVRAQISPGVCLFHGHENSFYSGIILDAIFN